MNDRKTAIFRADASSGIGGGHVVRCLTLADALAEGNWRCGFAVKPATLETVPALGLSRHEVLQLDCEPAEEPAALAARWPAATDWLIVDHYGRDATFESACRPWARRIMAIDDLADRAHDCDLLLDQTLGREAADYAAHAPHACRLLLGPDYALLRPAFAARRPAALARRKEGGPVRRILVSLGATDPSNVTPVVLNGIAHSGSEAEVDVVLGAAALGLPEVQRLIEQMPTTARLHIDAPNMAELMAGADLALGAGGTSCWERCCMGLPSLIVVTAPNQRCNAEALEQAGCAIGLGWHEELKPQTVAQTLRGWMANDLAIGEFGRRTASICDGLGSARLCMVLDGPLAKDGRRIRLRPATGADADDLLGWQNQPGARQHFRNTRVPDRAEHLAWLEARLADPLGSLSIILHDEQPSGSVRLDPADGSGGLPGTYEISILVSAAKRQLGLAKAALALVREMLPWADFHAEVASQNKASRRLFASAGFLEVGGSFVSPAVTAQTRNTGRGKVHRRA